MIISRLVDVFFQQGEGETPHTFSSEIKNANFKYSFRSMLIS